MGEPETGPLFADFANEFMRRQGRRMKPSNRELLTLYRLKWNPFATDLPVDSLMATPAIASFCRSIERHLVARANSR